jgi:hypothetical protein
MIKKNGPDCQPAQTGIVDHPFVVLILFESARLVVDLSRPDQKWTVIAVYSEGVPAQADVYPLYQRIWRITHRALRLAFLAPQAWLRTETIWAKSLVGQPVSVSCLVDVIMNLLARLQHISAAIVWQTSQVILR